MVLAVLATLCIGVRPAWAKDVTNSTNDPVLVKANRTYTHKFEKKGDRDCFYFVSGGGSYKVVVTDLSGRPLKVYGKVDSEEDWVWWEELTGAGIQTSYGDYRYSSLSGVEPASWNVGSTLLTYEFGGFEFDADSGKTNHEFTLQLDKHKAGKCVALIFDGDYKGTYKFKVIGKAAAKSEIVKKANPVKAKAKLASVTVKHSKAKAASVRLKSNVKITKAGIGSVSYKNASTQAKAKKFKVNAANGKILIPKGTKKGVYTVKIKVVYGGDIGHKSGCAKVAYKVVVK